MQATVDVNVRVNLDMSLEEARWLQAQMQNPLHGYTDAAESSVDCHYRYSFFRSLQEQTENHE